VGKLIFLLIVGYVIFMISRGFTRKKVAESKKRQVEDTHRDPVCGVFVSEEDAVVGRLDDKKYYFCSMECLEKYRASLQKKD
jgi:YHS domain-containing protein